MSTRCNTKKKLLGDKIKNEKFLLRGFAWLAVMASYSPKFLESQQNKLPMWIDSLSSSHTLEGLWKLMQQTHDSFDEWSVPNMTQQIRDYRFNNKLPSVRLCVGELDEMASIEQVFQLAKRLGCENECVTVISGSGHACPLEAPRAWRLDVLAHCSKQMMNHQVSRSTKI